MNNLQFLNMSIKKAKSPTKPTTQVNVDVHILKSFTDIDQHYSIFFVEVPLS